MTITGTMICMICGVALFSSFIHGAVGLGYGMIAMGIMTMFVPYANCAAIVSLELLLLTVQIVFTLRKNIDWHLVLVPTLVMLVGKVLGIVILMNLEGSVMKLLLGGTLVLFSINGLFVKSDRLQVKGNRINAVVFPFLGGLFGGMFNVAGPAAALYYQAACGEDTKKYSACLNFTFVPSALVGVAMHAYYGNFSSGVLAASGISLLAVILGTYLGVRLFVKIDHVRLKKITYTYIGLMGIVICLT